MTDAELAILSLLSEGPSFDHDLHTAIEARGLRRWTAIGYSSMYYVLDKLERQGLIERVSEDHGHRRYRLSSAGTGVLQTAIADLLSTPRAYDKSFELGLANLHVLKPGQVRSALHNRQQDMAMKLTQLREDRIETNSTFQIDSLYAHHITMMEAELAWLDAFIADWEAQAPAEIEAPITPEIAPRIKQVILPQDPDSVHKQSTQHDVLHILPTQASKQTPPQGSRPDDKSKT